MKATNRKRERRTSGPPKLATAAGQGLGFSLQVTRLLARLLEDCAPGDSVCLEAFSDVGVAKADGTAIAEETKSTHGYNPVSDRAVSLWKTLANWLHAAKVGAISPKRTRFVLYVSIPVEPGVVAQSFVQAGDGASALAALRKAREGLWGSAPEFSTREKLPAELGFQIARLWSDTTISRHLPDIIANFEIVLGTGSPTADLRALMSRQLISPEMCETVTRWALGWVKLETDKLLEQSLPAYLAYDDFKGALLAFCRTHDRTDMLMGFAGEPSAAEIDAHRQFRNYVRQLELVEADDEDILGAVNDHLRAAVDRTTWAEKGYVDPEMLQTYEKELKRTWKNHRDQTALAQSALGAEARGRLLFLRCAEHRAAVNGQQCPEYFTRGSFHSLSDALTIGWHPDYSTLLPRRTGGT